MHWTPEERRYLRSLSTPEKIQAELNQLIYNPTNHASSPRWVMITKEAHCFEGAMLAACALELQGHRPLLVDLVAQDDDHHVITVYKSATGWGSLGKSNTTLLSGRSPLYRTIRELVMSYFDFYFNVKGKLTLYSHSGAINLNAYNHLHWRTSDEDLMDMGSSFIDYPHSTIIDPRALKKLPLVEDRVREAGLLGIDPEGLYKA